MKLAINLALSTGMLILCVWLVWPSDPSALADAFGKLEFASFWPYLVGYTALLAANHFFRAWRWNNLLEPIGVKLGAGRLLAVSSVGFMAILALPARLGEFVRPALIREKGKVSASAALGTVAVERIVDGLIVSLFVFVAFFALRGPEAPGWMMPTAYIALGVFAGALTFLAFALRWPKETVRFCIRMSLLPRISGRFAALVQDKLLSMISGFLVLTDKRNLLVFVGWSLLYWISNGLSVWLLAAGFGLGLSLWGAFAVVGLVAVGISLPNAPALAGQYHWLTTLGLSLYLPAVTVENDGLAFAVVLHGLQVLWYIGVGGLALLTKYVSFSELTSSRQNIEE